ncbi:MAG: enhanced intracellular survival protein Eis [Phycisphaerales bacterium]
MMRTYQPVSGDADIKSVARLISLCFSGPVERTEEWARSAGVENIRVLRDGAAPPGACLLRLPMGQFFGGRSVPMVGIAGVAVGPEDRGRGLAREMMERAVVELAAEGVPLSGLYASTQALYRQVGFEQCGHWCRVTLPVAKIGVRERAQSVRELTDADTPAIEACYRAFASRFNGPLDRGAYVWGRIRKHRDEAFRPFGVFDEAGRLEGYLFLAQRRKDDTGRQDLHLTDLAFLTARAGRRLLTLLADYSTIVDDATFHAGPAHPVLALMPMQSYEVRRREYWMLRVLSVKGALEARGYLASVSGRFTLNIEDEVVPANSGAWTVRAEGGRAAVSRGAAAGAPTLRCGVGGLAAIYTGYFTGREAALAGLVEGADDALDAATAIFSGGTPWMADMF